jgi:acetolactate synthase-1/2/3 large subunit
MAEIYGRLTGKAGVCAATLGPGAINLLLGVADGHLNSAPLVAISAQAGIIVSTKSRTRVSIWSASLSRQPNGRTCC